MKYFLGIIVCLIIFGLPAGSYYYLDKGYNYRMTALKEIEPKGIIQDVKVVGAEQENLHQVLNKQTSLIYHGALNQENREVIDRVFEKYGERDLFQIFGLHKDSSTLNRVDLWQEFVVADEDILFDSEDMILVDTSYQIRSRYMFEEQDIKDMVKHVAIVIPLPTRKTVRLKREMIKEK